MNNLMNGWFMYLMDSTAVKKSVQQTVPGDDLDASSVFPRQAKHKLNITINAKGMAGLHQHQYLNWSSIMC